MSGTVSGRTIDNSRHQGYCYEACRRRHTAASCPCTFMVWQSITALWSWQRDSPESAPVSTQPCESLKRNEVLQEVTSFMTSCYGAKEADMTTARFNAWESKVGNEKLTSAPQHQIPSNCTFVVPIFRLPLEISPATCSSTSISNSIRVATVHWTKDPKY